MGVVGWGCWGSCWVGSSKIWT